MRPTKTLPNTQKTISLKKWSQDAKTGFWSIKILIIYIDINNLYCTFVAWCVIAVISIRSTHLKIIKIMSLFCSSKLCISVFLIHALLLSCNLIKPSFSWRNKFEVTYNRSVNIITEDVE